MAYIFPIDPVDGQLYPNPAIAGSLQYIWNEGQYAWLIYSPLGVQSVSGVLPIVVSNGDDDAVVSILNATVSTAGAMSPEDKVKLDSLPTSFGSVTSVAAGPGLLTDRPGNAPITTTGTIRLLPPAGTAIGGVKAGAGINIAADGTISSNTGTVTSINCVDGIIAAPNPITAVGTIALRPASNLLIGGVIVGAGLSVDGAGLLRVSQDILVRANGIAAWGTFALQFDKSPPVFLLQDSYNVQSVAYIGGPNAVARITFQTPLTDNSYSFLANARVYTSNPDPGTGFVEQDSTVVSGKFKTATYADIAIATTYTTNNAVAGGTTVWNNWGSSRLVATHSPYEIDFAAFDTRVI